MSQNIADYQVGTATIQVGDKTYPVRLTEKPDKTMVYEIWAPLGENSWFHHHGKIPSV